MGLAAATIWAFGTVAAAFALQDVVSGKTGIDGQRSRLFWQKNLCQLTKKTVLAAILNGSLEMRLSFDRVTNLYA